ncbi:MAG: polysaccharide deacetylase family protein [Clostridiales bacterium]|nr:polysaccharide deacetylase family protein [Clostridiales bacterium]
MNKRIVAGFLLASFVVSCVLSGCSDKKTIPDSKAPVSDTSVTTSEVATEPTTESTTETTTESTAEPTTESTTEPSTQATTEPTTVTTTEATTETTTEPTTEATTEPTTEATTEATTEETTEPTTEPTTAAPTKAPLPSDEGGDYLTRIHNLRDSIIANAGYYDSLDNTMKESWCFQRKKDHSPSGTYEFFNIRDYNGAYINYNVPEGDKVIYLTFDCGYPSANTEAILNTLAKHNAKASFFVTKMYLKECSGYAKRMKEEGHMVCNHTVTHTDLVTKNVEEIAKEIFDVAEYFYEVTGYTFDPYFRTPKGTYTKKLMTIISDAGYKTVFWSIAYNDYEPDNQPAPGYVTDHFATYHHNGAIALMHNDSTSNVNELDAVLTLLENEGYRFGLLDELN